MLTKDTGKSLSDKLWTHGPEILVNPSQWKPYKPPQAKIDSIPVFCGNVSLLVYPEELPNIDEQVNLSELHKETVKLCFPSSKHTPLPV